MQGAACGPSDWQWTPLSLHRGTPSHEKGTDDASAFVRDEQPVAVAWMPAGGMVERITPPAQRAGRRSSAWIEIRAWWGGRRPIVAVTCR